MSLVRDAPCNLFGVNKAVENQSTVEFVESVGRSGPGRFSRLVKKVLILYILTTSLKLEKGHNNNNCNIGLYIMPYYCQGLHTYFAKLLLLVFRKS